MGNKPFKIVVSLDQNVCKAGEVLTGKVYLSIGMLSDVKHFRGIHLTLNGVERSEVAAKPGTLEYDSRRRSGKPTVETSTQTIVHVDYPLVDLRGITRGQYEYPFQLPLRDDLPSSVRCSLGDSSDTSYCEIKYTLTAYIVCDINMTDYQLSHELILQVKSTPLDVTGPRPITTDTQIYPITTCWFWGQGHIALGWEADRSVAAPGDNVHVRVWGENQSKLDVDYISVKWMETVTWHTENGHGGTKRSRRFLDEQRQSARSHEEWEAKPLSSSFSNAQLLQSQSHPSIVSTLKIPDSARDTYKGHLVEVKHDLVVCVLTAGGYSSSTPESAYSVRICHGGRRGGGGGCGAASSVPASAFASAAAAAAATEMPPPMPVPISSNNSNRYPDHNPEYSEHQPLVEAQALPGDWQPVEAEVISLPMASAFIIPDSVNVARVPCTPFASAPVEEDGQAVVVEDRDAYDAKMFMTNPKPAPVLPGGDELSQLALLVRECPENLPVVLEDPAWAARIQQLSPRDFCKFVQAAGSNSGGPQTSAAIARTLALRMGYHFQTKHVLACLWTIGDVDRMALIREVVPLASDLRSKIALIEEELSREEVVAFRAAIAC